MNGAEDKQQQIETSCIYNMNITGEENKREGGGLEKKPIFFPLSFPLLQEKTNH